MEVLGWIVGSLFIFAMLTALAAGLMGDHGEDAPEDSTGRSRHENAPPKRGSHRIGTRPEGRVESLPHPKSRRLNESDYAGIINR
jgi:hypothetical protein